MGEGGTGGKMRKSQGFRAGRQGFVPVKGKRCGCCERAKVRSGTGRGLGILGST